MLFVELGTSEKQWEDVATARHIARALISALRLAKEYEKCAIGIGGTHYPEKLNKVILDSEIAIGPIIPKHSLEYFSKDILEQMVSKSDQNVNAVLVDNKGLGKHKELVMKVLENSSLEKISA